MSAVAAPPPAPRIGDNERLSATVVFSLLLHGLLVLGVGFALDDAAPVLPTLDVILTQTQTPLTPKQADFLAQANNQGGGEHDKSARPTDAQTGIAPQPEPGVAAQPLRRQSPAPQPPPEARVITAVRSDTRAPQAQETPTPTDIPYPQGRQKVERDMEMARLAAEIHLRSERYAKRPKRKFVSASTKEYAYAAYLRGWVDRVERVGNLNYPDEARRRRIGGLLVISVAVRRDGSIERADIIQSSHTPMLDAAALRIVKLSEPFAPLPKTEENVDILHVVRTWQFTPGGELIDR
ncbi:cell envelope biogenesis protein TonB [Lysobacter helvus]|uniref:Cell envelope biogenesis protein TonB n=2 Tax=Lysobacteraceae TaxID=32033 RepID=A0ABN6FPR3_9GAMM|nr:MULTISPECIES: energy transducer TonB [Lysobacter]BCT91602.1 cell envelope biogenesis protein TonB [Lysobacter caseinilyticus]BCT94755.1 cell envelope biogenesis protein TonB [Lysobacter helvus]